MTRRKPGPAPRAGGPTRLFTLRLAEHERARWVAAAEREVLSLSELVRAAVERHIARKDET